MGVDGGGADGGTGASYNSKRAVDFVIGVGSGRAGKSRYISDGLFTAGDSPGGT